MSRIPAQGLEAARRALPAVGLILMCGGLLATLDAQRAGSFMGSSEDPAIGYSTARLNNVVEEANRKILAGAVPLTFEGRGGFLRSALEALQIPVDSQLLVFSGDSLQGKLINEQSPRAIYFNDRVTLGWVRDGEFLEVAAHDSPRACVLHPRSATARLRPPQIIAGPLYGVHASGDTSPARPRMFRRRNPSIARPGPATLDHSAPMPAVSEGGSSRAAPCDAERAMRGSVKIRSEERARPGLFDPDGYPAFRRLVPTRVRAQPV